MSQRRMCHTCTATFHRLSRHIRVVLDCPLSTHRATKRNRRQNLRNKTNNRSTYVSLGILIWTWERYSHFNIPRRKAEFIPTLQHSASVMHVVVLSSSEGSCRSWSDTPRCCCVCIKGNDQRSALGRHLRGVVVFFVLSAGVPHIDSFPEGVVAC